MNYFFISILEFASEGTVHELMESIPGLYGKDKMGQKQFLQVQKVLKMLRVKVQNSVLDSLPFGPRLAWLVVLWQIWQQVPLVSYQRYLNKSNRVLIHL